MPYVCEICTCTFVKSFYYYDDVVNLVVITDPGIKVDHGYKPYDDGISQGVFIKVHLCIV